MQNDKLLPCPFCGGVGIYNEERICIGHGEYLETIYIQCVDCKATGGSVTDRDERNPKERVVLVANKWNNRKPMERIVEQLEELKEDVAGWIDDDIYLGKYKAYKKAIEIVKVGGKE